MSAFEGMSDSKKSIEQEKTLFRDSLPPGARSAPMPPAEAITPEKSFSLDDSAVFGIDEIERSPPRQRTIMPEASEETFRKFHQKPRPSELTINTRLSPSQPSASMNGWGQLSEPESTFGCLRLNRQPSHRLVPLEVTPGMFPGKPGKRLFTTKQELAEVMEQFKMNQPSNRSLDKGLMWTMMRKFLPTDVDTIRKQIVSHLEYTLAQSEYNLSPASACKATALSIRDRLIEYWNDTQTFFSQENCKRAYYMSIEYLMGRSMLNAMLNLGVTKQYAEALKGLGFGFEQILEHEKDAALGNGGLGRLAACYLDSAATLNLPVWGYGIRYDYGVFRQEISDGWQKELPDFWLARQNPWEIPRDDVRYKVRFFGGCQPREGTEKMPHCDMRYKWSGGQKVLAVAYDVPIPGYRTENVLNLRLWSSNPTEEFDFDSFNRADYYNAVAARQESQQITSVLYPNDATPEGKELRLKQQYFFASATLSDILRRFERSQKQLTQLHEMAAIQLNDTHPTIAIAELMRVLIDKKALTWKQAWSTTQKVFSFTNHTILPESLESWPVPLFEKLLPRHLGIIYMINFYFLEEIRRRKGDDIALIRRLSIVEEGNPKRIRMANLAIVGSHSVNGVAAMHTEIIKDRIFKDFYDLYPEKFQNITNGVTPRRWILEANPKLASLFDQWLQTDDWTNNLPLLKQLSQHALSHKMQQQWEVVKQDNKRRLAEYVMKMQNICIDTAALFSVQVKRIHEYKRQLLYILHVLSEHLIQSRLSDAELDKCQSRVYIVGGKAAPAYHTAKLIIKLIHTAADYIRKQHNLRHGQSSRVLMKTQVVFLADYRVSVAEIVVPAADVSEHISTAGTEASGTGNMKFAMNGGLLLGTRDGATVELAEYIGEENVYFFGATSEEVTKTREAYSNGSRETLDPRLVAVLDLVSSDEFSKVKHFEQLVNDIRSGQDHYLIAKDFASYHDIQDKVAKDYGERQMWIKKSILTAANTGYFSSDRSVQQYANDIWHVENYPMDLTRSSTPQEEETIDDTSAND